MSYQAFRRAARTMFDTDSRLIDTGRVAGAEDFQTVRMHRSSSDQATNQQAIPNALKGRVGMQEVDAEGGKAILSQPFGARSLDAHAPNSNCVFATTDPDGVARYNTDGSTLHVDVVYRACVTWTHLPADATHTGTICLECRFVQVVYAVAVSALSGAAWSDSGRPSPSGPALYCSRMFGYAV